MAVGAAVGAVVVVVVAKEVSGPVEVDPAVEGDRIIRELTS